jgi:uncharacterized protein GlcG (DUF336 family)
VHRVRGNSIHLREAPIPTRRILIGLLVLAGAGSGTHVVKAEAQAASLTADDVDRIVTQAAAEAQRLGLRAHVAVTDAEGNVLALFRMTGAADSSVVAGTPGQGLEGMSLPATLVAITKAGSGAFLSSGSRAGGNAFSTRTASFIVQDHFPPAVDFTPGGPLFGVQFSSLVCSDIKRPALPLGLSGDPGGLPVYKDGVLAGGVGVEGDGRYGADTDPRTLDDVDDAAAEEQSALAGTRGFEVPELIRANRILADGIRLPYVNVQMPPASGAAPGQYLTAARASVPPLLVTATIGEAVGRADPRYPVRAGSVLTTADVVRILVQGVQQAARTRAAIRQPLGSDARVSYAVVDVDGSVLALFQNAEAPNFGIDVAVQKARTANFFSSPTAGDDLRRAGLTRYLGDGLPLDGSVAYTSRAIGFLAQPHYPPGIENAAEGPFSKPRANDEWSPFNTGLQLDIVQGALAQVLGGGRPSSCSTPLPTLPNGITIFPGGVPLFKDGRLAGAIGISGDGVDQDDLIAWAASIGFEAPETRRCDQLTIRGARLPYVKFPRHPEL